MFLGAIRRFCRLKRLQVVGTIHVECSGSARGPKRGHRRCLAGARKSLQRGRARNILRIPRGTRVCIGSYKVQADAHAWLSGLSCSEAQPAGSCTLSASSPSSQDCSQSAAEQPLRYLSPGAGAAAAAATSRHPPLWASQGAQRRRMRALGWTSRKSNTRQAHREGLCRGVGLCCPTGGLRQLADTLVSLSLLPFAPNPCPGPLPRPQVGKKLPRAQNQTDTSFKSRTISLAEQSVAADKGGQAVTTRNLTLKASLGLVFAVFLSVLLSVRASAPRRVRRGSRQMRAVGPARPQPYPRPEACRDVNSPRVVP